MSNAPWWMNPDEVLGVLSFPEVKKPAQFDRELLKLPDLGPELAAVQERSLIVEGYLKGTVNAVSERMERAAEAMLTDERGWGILAIEEWEGMTIRVGVWLHPDVPFGKIQHHKVPSAVEYIAVDAALSEGRARLIE